MTEAEQSNREAAGAPESAAAGPRVVLLARYFPPTYSGAGLQAATLVRWLVRRGARVTVLAPRPRRSPADAFSRSIPARVHYFPTPRPRRLRDHALGLYAGAWLLAHRGWDILHLLDFSYHCVLPTWVARRRRRPVLIKTTLLDPSPGADSGVRLLDRLRRWGYGGADTVVAISDALESDLRERWGVRGRVARIPNGVDIELFHPASKAERSAARRAFDLPDEAWTVVTTGALIPRKNATTLLAAAARMRTRPLHVVLAGPPSMLPEDRSQLEQALAVLPAGVVVHRTGKLPPPRVAELLLAADAFALPSRAEGMPNALLEAMASGLPCAASDIPGSRDVLAGGGGLLVPLDDADALAETLDRFAQDSTLRSRVAAEARRVVEDRYGMDRVADRYLALYRTLLERSGSPAGC
jgi:glycosyltransferase involved in cell wall biosynthesis